jgi:aminopeptidase N
VRHYDLALQVFPDRREIAGVLTATVEAVETLPTLLLDLDPLLTVERVTVDGREAAFEHARGRLRVTLDPPARAGQELAAAVHYGGAPRVAPRAPWEGGFVWSQAADGSPWFATACQMEGADLWWPCKDHPSDKAESVDLHFRVPDGLVVATNGRRLRVEDHGDGTHTSHWRVSTPIPNYGVALNVGPYVEIERTARSSDGSEYPAVFWALPENEAAATAAFDEFLGHVAWFEQNFGPYPFRADKYGVVETPHLGMEHQTIIAYGNRYRRTGFDYDWLHHHEMCHEWWANLVTNRNWKDMWIHEGIGTYMQALYIEEKFGPEAYRTEMGIKRRSLVNKVAVAPRDGVDSQGIYFAGSGNDIYYKGSWICHSLRYLLGDETFFTILRRWAYPDPAMEKVTDGSQCRFTDTAEIRRIAEDIAERDLGWFFDAYVHQPELPKLVTEVRDGVLHLRWETPDDLPFPMPVPVRVGEETVRVEMKDGTGTLEVGDKEHAVDPDRWLLRAGRGR